MAIIFQDFFEEEVETLLEHHTPDIGTGWSILFDSFTTAVVVVKPLGGAGEPYVVSPDTSNNGMGRAFALQPAPASADVAVEIDVFETDWSRANTYNRGLFARDTGGHTHYAVSILPNGNSQPSIRLFKTVAGSSDVIGSHDATLQNGDVIRFECYDASKRVLLNGVEVISVADNDIAGPGGAGLYWGNWNGQNGGGHPDRRSDIGFITVEAAQVGPVHVDLSAAPAGTATASAAVQAARTLSAGSAGQADIGAAVHATRALAALGGGQTDVTVGMQPVRGLSAEARGATAADTALAVRRDLSAAATGATTVTATLDARSAVDLAVMIAGSTTVTAGVEALGTVELAAEIAGATAITAALARSFDLAATPAGATTVVGDVAALRDFVAGIDGHTSVEAAPVLLRGLTASPFGATAVDATLHALSYTDFAAALAGQTLVDAALVVQFLGALGDVTTWVEPVTDVSLRGERVADVRTAIEVGS